jgi:acetoin utilization deacetylase AcuC-like enzyme
VKPAPAEGRSFAEAEPPAVLLVDDRRFELHTPLGHHPERPERLVAAREALGHVRARFDTVAGRPATDDEILRVHRSEYLEKLSTLRGQRGYLDPDTYFSPDTVDVARLAAGSLVAMVGALVAGPVSKGVALLRPPGHHARPGGAMGFCLLNSVAIAAAHARSLGLARVAVVDWDVHHGNGTQEMFWRDPGVVYVSTHQFPFYPGTGDVDEVGEDEGEGFTVNIPLGAGAGDAAYAAAFRRIVIPVLTQYAPELVLVSAGFDAATRDPLAQMDVTAQGFGWMARELAAVADASAGGRMALVLEGGYDLVALEGGMRAAIEGCVLGKADEPAAGHDAAGYDDVGVDRAAAWAKKSWRAVGRSP